MIFSVRVNYKTSIRFHWLRDNEMVERGRSFLCFLCKRNKSQRDCKCLKICWTDGSFYALARFRQLILLRFNLTTIFSENSMKMSQNIIPVLNVQIDMLLEENYFLRAIGIEKNCPLYRETHFTWVIKFISRFQVTNGVYWITARLVWTRQIHRLRINKHLSFVQRIYVTWNR